MKPDEMAVQEKSAVKSPEESDVKSTLTDIIDPDLKFIKSMRNRLGDTFIKCFQCGTCSATCTISPDTKPFPRKEMSWINWGMKDLLLKDPDIWLCYQCNDCSTRCPRGARPGEMMNALREECIKKYSFPGFFARWVNEPQSIPILLAIPVILLGLALYFKDSLGESFGFVNPVGEEIIYAYSSLFPHWLLNGFFFFFTFLMLIVVVIGIGRYWNALKSGPVRSRNGTSGKSLPSSIGATIKKIFIHDRFTNCTKAKPRFWSHILVFFGFLALTLVTTWIITSRINPLIYEDFVYPFGFWNPWKILANLGGLALLAGLVLMIRDRFKNEERVSKGSYFDWALITTLFIVIGTGFITEILHYIRLEPHRHVAYFVHLVFIFALLIYLPYSKFAHLAYRTTALVYAEYTGRSAEINSAIEAKTEHLESEENPLTESVDA